MALEASARPASWPADDFEGTDNAGAVMTETSNDLVQEDLGPIHIHRGRDQSRHGKEVLWRDSEPGEPGVTYSENVDKLEDRQVGAAFGSHCSQWKCRAFESRDELYT